MSYIYIAITKIQNVIHRFCIEPFIKKSFSKCGSQVRIGKKCSFNNVKNIYIGNNISIGKGSMIMSTKAKVIIQDYVMFGPNVTIVTGDHRTDYMGKFLVEVKDSDKHKKNDQDVIFKGDNWVGTGAIILKGVIVGEGAVIAAGSVVNRNVEPYSIVAGVPAKKIGMRFDEEDLVKHKKMMTEK